MSRFNRLAVVLLAAALAGPVVHLDGKTRKGNAFFAEGAKYEEKKEWDEALASYEKALAEDPSDVSYRIAAEKARVAASGRAAISRPLETMGTAPRINVVDERP